VSNPYTRVEGFLTSIVVRDRLDTAFGIDQIEFDTTGGKINFYDDAPTSGGEPGKFFTAGHVYPPGEDITDADKGCALILKDNKVFKSVTPNDKRIIGFMGYKTSLPSSITFQGSDNIYVVGIGDSFVRKYNRETEQSEQIVFGCNFCNEGGNIETGDLFCTSSIPGYFMKQNDDSIHSYTAGKCMENITFDSSGKKQNVYCIMMCG
jgi:hypothetical protein